MLQPQAVKDIPIDRCSFETEELLAANFARWAIDIASAGAAR